MLTEEQLQAVKLANGSYADLKIEAFAGAGKTTTLKAIAEGRGDSGLYIAFNKAIQTDAASKFPANVECRTGHSLAFREVGKRYAKRIRSVNSADVKNALDVQRTDLHSESGIAYLAIDAVRRFCYSADAEVSVKHVDADIVSKEPETAAYVKRLASQIWNLMESDGDFPVTHDFYLKLWQLKGPDLPYDFILFDECQDANAVILDVVESQSSLAQKIYVGDRYQQIYSWRGALNAMDEINTKNECKITQSFRFGQPIADYANLILRKLLVANTDIKGFDKIESTLGRVENPDAVLFRTNSAMISEIIQESEGSKKIYVEGGVSSLISLIQGAQSLSEGKRSYNSELVGFAEWGDLVEFAETTAGQPMKKIVKMVSEGYADDVLKGLEKQKYNKKSKADVVFSTCHKSKGLEFNTVRIYDDFPITNLAGLCVVHPEDARLLYVAATRAQNVLDVCGHSIDKLIKTGQ